mgnify:CR=1 FL=1
MVWSEEASSKATLAHRCSGARPTKVPEMAIRNLSRYVSTNVPRYTSYPTAPHFSSSIGPDRYETWLSELPEKGSTSLYVHVPFCRSICAYCGCMTKATKRDEPIVAYGNTLLQEIELVARQLKSRPTVTHLHWGGGTPSLLPRPLFDQVLAAFDRHFDMDGIEEHAMELDPRHVDAPLARALKEQGVNRVSLGVQDLNARVQQAIGRVQPLEVVDKAVAALRDAGHNAVNMDVMYGLPQQSLEDVVRSVTACAALGADRIALFGYAHVPWMKANQKLIKTEDLPSAGARLEQVRAAHKALHHLGYLPVGFDHFAQAHDPMAKAVQAGTLRRNFQGYTTDTAPTMIAFGASAIGKLPQGYVQNAPDTPGWARRVLDGELAAVRGFEMTDEDRLRGEIIEDLLTNFCVDLAERRAGIAPGQSWINQQIIGLDDLVEDGLCTILGSRVSIPADARFLARIVAARFDGYLQGERAKHSSAV